MNIKGSRARENISNNDPRNIKVNRKINLLKKILLK